MKGGSSRACISLASPIRVPPFPSFSLSAGGIVIDKDTRSILLVKRKSRTHSVPYMSSLSAGSVFWTDEIETGYEYKRWQFPGGNVEAMRGGNYWNSNA